MTILTDKLTLIIILLFSIVTLLIVFIAELIFGLDPCILCKYQRIPYFSIILFSCLSLFSKTADRQGVLKFIGYIFLAGSFLAFYHNGVEQHWWNAATGCGDTNQIFSNFEEFQNLLKIKMPKRCDEINWTLFGLSMTVYNMLLSFILGILCLTYDKLCTKNRDI